jgi:hypothetical protein
VSRLDEWVDGWIKVEDYTRVFAYLFVFGIPLMALEWRLHAPREGKKKEESRLKSLGRPIRRPSSKPPQPCIFSASPHRGSRHRYSTISSLSCSAAS